MLSWQTTDIGTACRYLKITNMEPDITIHELLIYGADAEVPLPVSQIIYSNFTQNRPENLFDEQEKAVQISNYTNSTYFDEIYHVRTAYEYLQGFSPYETTHPPLGKILISVGIMLFGLNPFGWRFMGVVCGILLVPFMYLFGKKLFGRKLFAVFASLLMAFDFMHFTQSRIGTVDTFVTLFVVLSYFFMFCFYRQYIKRDKKAFLWLLLSGICFGLGAATKWNFLYCGIGLAVFFFYTVYLVWKKRKAERANYKPLAKVIVSAAVFFVIIPALLYYVSYIP